MRYEWAGNMKYEWVIWGMNEWMSHIVCMNESCCLCVTLFVLPQVIHTCYPMSCTYKWVISYIWMRHIACMNESYYSLMAPHLLHRTLFMCATPCLLHMTASYHIYGWVIIFICATWVVPPYVFVGAHVIYIWMSHIAYINESCYSFVPPHLCHRTFRGCPCHLHMNESYCIYEWVLLLICATSFAPP